MKLISKIASLSVGLALAVGVGVAVGSRSARVARAAEPDTNKYQKITAVSGLSAGDKAVLYNATDNEGVTGTSGTKDASVASSGWLEYTVAKTASGFTLEASSGSYVTLGTKSFSHSSTATDLSVTSNGYLCTVANADNILYHQNTYVRTYTGKSSDNTYHPFAVYKVLNSGPVVSYTITYDANGGSGSMEDSTNTVSACTFTAPEGKRFKEWNVAADGSGASYAQGDSATSDLDLFAIWEDKPLAVTLDKIGTTLGSTANTTMATVDILDGSDTYTLNYLQCKKQGDSMFMTKDVSPFISNHTEIPGSITSVEVFINSGASGKTNYDVAFGTTEFTTATTGIGSVNITGGNSHVFENESVSDAKYFCITLGNANNGQVLKVVVNYENGVDPSKDTLVVKLNDSSVSPQTLPYSSTGSWLFYANDKDGNDINADWSSSNEAIFTVAKNGNNVAVVTPHSGGTATLTASADGYNSGSFVLTVDVGTVSSVSLANDMTNKTYTLGDNWNPAGLELTATYSTGYSEKPTSGITWSYNPEKPEYGGTSVVVTATFGGKTSSKTVTGITVNTVETTSLSDFYDGTITLPTSSGSSDWYYVKGVVVAVNGYQYYIQEGEYGLLVYGNESKHPTWYEGVAVGDYVLLHAKIYRYVAKGDTAGGLVETYNGEATQTVTKLGTAALPAAAEYSSVSAFLAGHQSIRASLSNIAVDSDNVTTISGFSGTSTDDQKFTVYDVNSSSDVVTVIIHKSLSDENKTAIVEKLKTITTDYTIEFVRSVVAYYNGNQISIASADQFIIHTPTEDKLAAWGVDYLFMGNPAFDGDGTGACKTANYYVDAKTKLFELESVESGSIDKLQEDATYADELARYLAWAKACGDHSPFENDFTFMNAALNMFGSEANPTIFIVIAIATASTLAFTLLLVFKKRKHN